MADKTLLGRILPGVFVLMAVTLLVAGWVAAGVFRSASSEKLAAALEVQAGRLVPLAAQVLLRKEPARGACRKLAAGGPLRVTVVRPSGAVACDSQAQPGRMENLAGRPEVARALTGRVGMAMGRAAPDQPTRLFLAVPLPLRGRAGGALLLGQALPGTAAVLRGLAWRLLIAGGFLAVVAGWVAFWLARRWGGFYRDLEVGIEAFTEGNLRRRLPTAGFREGSRLAGALNAMAAKLAGGMERYARRQNELEAVLASMVEAVLAVDEQERVLDLNASAARLFGVELAAARGRYLMEVVRLPDLLRFVARTLAAEGPQQGEIEMPGPQQDATTLQAHGTVLRDAAGRGIGALVVLHDVSRLRRLEMLRRDFVANVSHELKTPITAIKGVVESLRDGALDDPAQAQRFLAILARQADRLEAIIEELLNLSRIEKDSGQAGIRLAPAAVQPVLKASLLVCRDRAQEKAVKLKLLCPDHLTAVINPPLLEQALVNLIDNAIKYGGDSGVITVEAAAEQGGVAITVRDQGSGIASVHHPRLFERFYRVDRARSRHLGGTGLGLAIVKHIAQAHGGTAAVESRPGHGSAFTLHLPPPAGPSAPDSKE